MKTVIAAVTCLGLSAGMGHAKDITDVLGGMFKTPSKEDTRAELQPIIDKMDVEGLKTTLVDYAHQIKILQGQVAESRDTQQKLLTIIGGLRSEIAELKAR